MSRDVHDLLTALAGEAPEPALDLPRLKAQGRRRRHRRRALLAVPALVALLSVTALPLPQGKDALVPDTAAGDGETIEDLEGTELQLPLLHVVQLSPSGHIDGGAAEFDPATVTAGKDVTGQQVVLLKSVAVAFQPVPAPASCIRRAVLNMGDAAIDGSGELRVYPSAAISLGRGQLPPDGERPATLLDNRPAGSGTNAAQGSAFDVTDLVKTWTAGGPFPSRGRTVPSGTPIVLVVRPPDSTYGFYNYTWDTGNSPPELAVTLEPSCQTGGQVAVEPGYVPAGYTYVPGQAGGPARFTRSDVPASERHGTEITLVITPTIEFHGLAPEMEKTELQARGQRVIRLHDRTTNSSLYVWNEPDGTGLQLGTGSAVTTEEALRVIDNLRVSRVAHAG